MSHEFVDFTKTIRNVERLIFLDNTDYTDYIFNPFYIGEIVLSTENSLLLQQFFDQIMEIRIHGKYLSLKKFFSDQYKTLTDLQPMWDGDNVTPLTNIEFVNLRTVTIYGNHIPSACEGYQHIESSEIPFHKFCALNSNLKHLNIEIDQEKLFQSPNNYQIEWFTKFHATTAIESCKISIAIGYQKTSSRKLISWREGNFDEVQLFGKVRNEEENRFFV